MRIRVLSDLHGELGRVPLTEVAADVVVVTGGIDHGTRGVMWAWMTFPDMPVLYVAGNQEHHDERIGRLHEKLGDADAGSNVRLLATDPVELNGCRFFGATLWTDYNLFGDRLTRMTAVGAKEKGIYDYRKIRRTTPDGCSRSTRQ